MIQDLDMDGPVVIRHGQPMYAAKVSFDHTAEDGNAAVIMVMIGRAIKKLGGDPDPLPDHLLSSKSHEEFLEKCANLVHMEDVSKSYVFRRN